MLECAGNRGKRFKGSQRAEHKQRNQRARRGITAYTACRHPQHQNHGHPADQHHHGLRDRSEACLAALRFLPFAFGAVQRVTVATGGVKNRQLGMTNQPGGELLAILRAQGGKRFPRAFACAIEKGREQQHGQQHDPTQR